MIRKFRFGEPMETGAVVLTVPEEKENRVPYVQVSPDGLEITCGMAEEDIVYGLGEQVRGINKRGWVYESNCTDDSTHTEGKHSLYGAHNFLIIDGKELFGMFIDAPGNVRFDIGYTKPDVLRVTVAHPGYFLYVFSGGSKEKIVAEFRHLTGRSYIPPKWAFGYGQSRWSYMDEGEIREVVRKHRANHIPLDMIYLDIDYMDRYRDFTVNGRTFPDFPGFVREMKENHIRLIPIIDAGIKKEKGYSVYDEGTEKGYFCKDADGNDFVAAVWPGKSVLPDFLNSDVRRWFGNLYRVLTDDGIEGFWNDMNEPAIFYSEKRLQKIFEKAEAYRQMNLDANSFFEFRDMIGEMANHPEDYRSFYHRADGKKYRNDEVHNLYGFNMTRAAAEALEKICPGKRFLLFSRASYIGMHRYAGIWTGDNRAWWSQLELGIKQMPSLNMCGFLYSGTDIGGFGDDTTPDLLMRWTEFGIFTPLMRNHSSRGTRRQELTEFPETQKELADIVRLRYMLLPYIYSEFVKAALTDGMYMKPLSFGYPEDRRAGTVEDQLLVGESMMIAPVYRQNETGRYVYLPEDMKLYRFRSIDDWDEEILEKGDHYVRVKLNEVLIFVRPEKLVPVCGGAEYAEGIDTGNLHSLSYIRTGAVYRMYDDDGEGTEFDLEKNIKEITEKNAPPLR
jgi:alpha-glucosidase